MTKSKLALVAIICLAFAPAALAEELDSIPPNSGEYGYIDGTQTLKRLRDAGYQAFAQAPSVGGQWVPSPVRPFTAEEKAVFDRQTAGDL